MLGNLFISLALITFGLMGPLNAQQQGAVSQAVQRTPLQKFDVPGTNYEVVVIGATIAADTTVGRHTHPGPESGYVIEGELTLMVEGRPNQILKVGQSYNVPAATAHDARTGEMPARIVAMYVVEKQKPLASPAQ